MARSETEGTYNRDSSRRSLIFITINLNFRIFASKMATIDDFKHHQAVYPQISNNECRLDY